MSNGSYMYIAWKISLLMKVWQERQHGRKPAGGECDKPRKQLFRTF
jgi:hypothetical protein